MGWCSKEVSKTTNQIISGHYKLLICGIMLWRHKMDSDSSSRREAEILHFQQVPRWQEHGQEAMIWGQIPSRSKDLGSDTFKKQGSGAKYLLFQLDPIKLRNRLLLWSGPLKHQVSIRYFPIMYWQWDLPAKEFYSETSGFSTPPLPCPCLKQRPQGLVCSQNSWRYRQKTRGRELLTTRGSFQRPGLPEVPHITSLPLLLSVSAEAYVRSDCAMHVIY